MGAVAPDVQSCCRSRARASGRCVDGILDDAQLSDSPAQAQLRSLAYAVRWDIGIDSRDFLGPVLEGDRWLVQAAGAVGLLHVSECISYTHGFYSS